MGKSVFINLPVSDLDRSVAFYRAIGFRLDERFTDETAAGLEYSEGVRLMLLTHEKWKTFTDKAMADPKKVAMASYALDMDSREAVDALVEKAAAAGGRADPSEPNDYGFMYGRGFEDPDGYVWDPFWMDLAAFEAAKKEMGQ